MLGGSKAKGNPKCKLSHLQSNVKRKQLLKDFWISWIENSTLWVTQNDVMVPKRKNASLPKNYYSLSVSSRCCDADSWPPTACLTFLPQLYHPLQTGTKPAWLCSHHPTEHGTELMPATKLYNQGNHISLGHCSSHFVPLQLPGKSHEAALKLHGAPQGVLFTQRTVACSLQRKSQIKRASIFKEYELPYHHRHQVNIQ